jgi:hypothetical protein
MFPRKLRKKLPQNPRLYGMKTMRNNTQSHVLAERVCLSPGDKIYLLVLLRPRHPPRDLPHHLINLSPNFLLLPLQRHF